MACYPTDGWGSGAEDGLHVRSDESAYGALRRVTQERDEAERKAVPECARQPIDRRARRDVLEGARQRAQAEARLLVCAVGQAAVALATRGQVKVNQRGDQVTQR